ncbi:MAG: DUF4339 domain-containing protein [Planctomycetota bacterium]
MPEKYAGKRVKCPKCEGTIGIPASGGPCSEEAVTGDKAAPKQTVSDAPAAERWFLQTEDGQQFGPASKSEMDDWLAEGRIDASCQLLCEGWEQWKWADEVFPDLAETPREAQQPAAAVEENPFAGIGEAVAPSPREVNPFVSPQEPAGGIDVAARSDDGGGDITPGMRQALAQTRPWVLFLSILGFIGAVLAGIVSLWYVVISVAAIGLLGAIGVIFLLAALMMAGTTVLWFFAAYYLYTYASTILKFLRSRQSGDMERALVAQKSYWKLVGMVTAIVVAVYLLLLAVFMALGGIASTMG